jgi:nitroreductase
MNTLEAICTRRSIRKYREGTIAPETLETILRAAMSAPSACNQQPWEFVIIDDPDILARVPSELNEHAAMCAGAALAILVCGNTSRETCPGNWHLDCAAATQNLLLAVHEAGLGAVWTGVYPDAQLRRAFQAFFGLPEEVMPLALVPIGIPDEQPEHEDRYMPERVHRNQW